METTNNINIEQAAKVSQSHSFRKQYLKKYISCNSQKLIKNKIAKREGEEKELTETRKKEKKKKKAITWLL